MGQDALKECPFCKERIQAAAIKCRYCGEWLEKRPENLADCSQHEEALQVHETRVDPDAISTPEESGKKSPPSQIEESALQPVTSAKAPLLTTKRLHVGSIVILGLSVAVMLFTLRDANFDNPTAVQKLTEAIGRMLIGAGVFGWVVWSSAGKRKGYGIITFSLVCIVMSLIFAYNFRVGVEAGRQHQRDSNRQLAASLSDFVQQTTNVGSVNQTVSSGNMDIDAAMRPLIDLRNDFNVSLEQMEVEITKLNSVDVFSPSVVTNKSNIETEVRKRKSSQAILEKYQKAIPPMIIAARQKFSSLSISADVKKGALRGFDNAMKIQAPAVDEMFRLRLGREEAEADLLQFLLSEFNEYRLVDGKITFSLPVKQQEYNRRDQNLKTAVSEANAFVKRQEAAFEEAKGKIRQLAE